jgi:hypothetical protein
MEHLEKDALRGSRSEIRMLAFFLVNSFSGDQVSGYRMGSRIKLMLNGNLVSMADDPPAILNPTDDSTNVADGMGRAVKPNVPSVHVSEA